jgi:acyl-CoA dehydrogenase
VIIVVTKFAPSFEDALQALPYAERLLAPLDIYASLPVLQLPASTGSGMAGSRLAGLSVFPPLLYDRARRLRAAKNMNDDTDTLILDTATRIFRDLCEPEVVNSTERGEWPRALWEALEESGLPLAWVPEELGGAGAQMADGFAALRVAGRFAAPVPLAETLMAGWLLSRAGIAAPPGPLTVAPVHADGHLTLDADGRLQGRARQVPFARHAGHIAVLARPNGETGGGATVAALVDAAALPKRHGASLAGEPRDNVDFAGAMPQATASVALDTDGLIALGAAVRLQQIAGALEKILDQSVQYALDRTQFGRPIAKFQAVQHNLAMLAGEVAAAGAAAAAAAEAFADGALRADGMAQVAIGKVRGGEAAGAGAAIAHQVHGAMGFTYEHSLHHATRRLWSWREEFGNETAWAIRLGQMVAAAGADGLWPFVTSGS